MHFSLPASYSAYATRQEVRAAVDHILDGKHLHVPHDLDWDQLPDFHAAVLAAHQVRCDYASALCCLWDKVWQTALDSSGLELEPLSIAETQDWGELALDTQSVWASGWFSRLFRKNGLYVDLEVDLEVSGARLSLWFGDYSGEKNQTADLLSPTAGWDPLPEDEDDGYFYTGKKVAPVSSDGVKLDRLKAAANLALKRIAEFTAG